MRGRGVFLRTLILSKAKDLWLIFQKGLIEILQPFGLQDEESGNSPTPQLNNGKMTLHLANSIVYSKWLSKGK